MVDPSEWCPVSEWSDSWSDDDGAADVVDFYGEFDDADGFVRVMADVDYAANDLVSAAYRRREVERRRVEARDRFVADGDKVRWNGALGFSEEEAAAYGLRELPGASPRLAAYVQRLSDGPTATWAWWLAWCQVTGAPQRFALPDRGDRSVWISRKLPEQIVQRVRRLAFDSRPVAS